MRVLFYTYADSERIEIDQLILVSQKNKKLPFYSFPY